MSAKCVAAGILAAAIASQASGAILFSTPVVTGTLGAGTVVSTGPADIDFSVPFDTGTVGDPATLRSGSVTYTYDVTGTAGEQIPRSVFSLLGGVQGNGSIAITVMVHDRPTGDMIGLYNATVNAANPPPNTTNINFTRASSQLQVIVQLQLSSPDTAGFELATVALIEQAYVPSPGAMALLGVAGLVAGRRRR